MIFSFSAIKGIHSKPRRRPSAGMGAKNRGPRDMYPFGAAYATDLGTQENCAGEEPHVSPAAVFLRGAVLSEARIRTKLHAPAARRERAGLLGA
jgi:hypothetical protein